MGDGNSYPLFLWGIIMEKEQRTKRIIELLEKEDFDCKDYEELKGLLAENDKEYYRLKEKYRDSAFGSHG
jgi:hypothetical protein